MLNQLQQINSCYLFDLCNKYGYLVYGLLKKIFILRVEEFSNLVNNQTDLASADIFEENENEVIK